MVTIRIWVYDGIMASGVAGPIDVFNAANLLSAQEATRGPTPSPIFAWRVESPDGQSVRAASGQSVPVDGKIDPRKRADAILLAAPFFSNMDEFVGRREQLNALSSALRRQHKAGAVLAAYCTGNYLLAEAGLLDGRVATTHWAKAADFAQRYPHVELRAREVLTGGDGILSGGSVTSYLNLAVRLVEMFAGEKLAAKTAKSLLIDMNRTSQASFATLLDEHGHADPLVARAQQRMEATLQQGFRLSELAAWLAVSERTLNRRFKQAVGLAPLAYLQNLRIEVAKQLLESRPISVDRVSQRVGYGDISTFRQLFKRKTSLSPSEYQMRFGRASVVDDTERE
ncbi:GlxA family transcriptional regulator [Paraburkholderia phenazinium]|jgi:transcriptional regulator GlxA family with amidase domain|uniref:Transcriptional regulator GlxA family, contains an amidase domain and an AraC-type DNA-binding HTH domain n=1 Tax=Paraburkholderia phenazinium TaxID=60549 RepID=A0A1G7RC58_9BURK|nr:helix-turn-helix domain-containing protein [Paraburkholderia phenazinium]SDG08332.1 Transcriptional regulator GlxA family, contains an amidase domain and an AraC-type DNA-binding HTH domain [Paraburkholderia phenazinium]